MTVLKVSAALTVHATPYFGYPGRDKLEQTQCLSLKDETVHRGQWRSVCPRRLASSVTPMQETRILQLFYIFIL
jgi:hypothetical protein